MQINIKVTSAEVSWRMLRNHWKFNEMENRILQEFFSGVYIVGRNIFLKATWGCMSPSPTSGTCSNNMK